MGTSSGFPPYEFIDTSKKEKTVVGIDIALAQKIADKIGVKLEVQDMSFSALLSSIAANKIAVASQGVVAQQYLIMNPALADSGVKFENVRSSSCVAIPKGNEDFVKLVNEVIAENEENIQNWVQEYSELAVKNAQSK